ncbi:nucleoside hydrolase [Diaminobutyricibacter sp. McL0608]|uniref:nucleoside hydrolase n=1 Tax=Leifsonia sp. McL0608 TaxID=3143537 RepID=UPI0031F32F80
MTTRLILDCDTGTDDAIAIMTAVGHPLLELVAVTTVNGNVPLENTTDNTLRVLDHVGADVPVFAGMDRPLTRPDFPIPRDVLNAGNPEFQVFELDLPVARTVQRSESAVDFLIDTYLSERGSDLVLVATGPLTNLAAVIAADPRIISRIPRLIVMGGAVRGGNVTAAAEFNFWADPEAAEAVLSAGIPDVTIVPLEATHSAPITLRHCDAFDGIGTPSALATSSFVRHRIRTQLPSETEGTPVHDALCIAYLIDPAVITSSARRSAHVETHGTRSVGELVVDDRPWSPESPNALVALQADPERYAATLSAALGAT